MYNPAQAQSYIRHVDRESTKLATRLATKTIKDRTSLEAPTVIPEAPCFFEISELKNE